MQGTRDLAGALLCAWVGAFGARPAEATPASAAAPALANADDSLYLDRIRRERDRTDVRNFYHVARDRTAEALHGLMEAVGYVHDPNVLEAAYYQFTRFAGGRHEAEAVGFLRDQALGSRKRAVPEVATTTLLWFEGAAHPALEEILRESDDEACRRIAIGPLIEGLCRSGTDEALLTILANAAPGAVSREPSPLLRFDEDLRRPHLVEKLRDRRTTIGWRIVLVDLLATDLRAEISDVLDDFLRSRSSTLQVAALHALEHRGQLAESEVQLERMHRSATPHVKVEVTRVLSGLSAGDPEWGQTLRSLASSFRYADRIAAAGGFAELGGAAAIDGLTELLGDRSWKVRAATIEAMEDLRELAFLEPLIDRLDVEDGRLRQDVADTLTRLTGRQMGLTSKRWRMWYEAEGFRTPLRSPWDALPVGRAAEADERTVATFYGLPIVSRAATFVLDLSESMQQYTGGGTRLDVAKREVGFVIERIPEDTRLNFVFFADDVDVWEDGLRSMDEEGKAEALGFVQRQVARGGTNLYAALTAALEDEDVDTVYVLSDGEPTVGELVEPVRIAREIDLWNEVAHVTFHCVSVGRAADLLERIAQDSGGQYREVGADERRR